MTKTDKSLISLLESYTGKKVILKEWKVTSRSNSIIAKRHALFIKELEALSKKYGVVISCIGGVWHDEPKNLQDLTYTNDFTSGDIEPKGYF